MTQEGEERGIRDKVLWGGGEKFLLPSTTPRVQEQPRPQPLALLDSCPSIRNQLMISKPSPTPVGCQVLISASPDSGPTQERSKPEGREGGVLEVSPLIRADVNAANWAEALHNVTAAAAIARVCWGPSRGWSCKDPFPAAREGG